MLDRGGRRGESGETWREERGGGRQGERGRERCTFVYGIHVHTLYLHGVNVLHGLDTNAMLLPRRVPGHKDSNVKLLPSSTTKHAIWELYLQAAATSSMQAVAYSTFTDLWRQLLPNIVVMKPMSDLCWVCQQNSARSANRPEEEKQVSGFRKCEIGACGHGFKHILLHADKQAEQHIMDVTTERSVHTALLDNAKSSIVAHFFSNGEFSPPPPGPETIKHEAHYSFDMAQQVFYPNSLAPCIPHATCDIFGVC